MRRARPWCGDLVASVPQNDCVPLRPESRALGGRLGGHGRLPLRSYAVAFSGSTLVILRRRSREDASGPFRE